MLEAQKIQARLEMLASQGQPSSAGGLKVRLIDIQKDAVQRDRLRVLATNFYQEGSPIKLPATNVLGRLLYGPLDQRFDRVLTIDLVLKDGCGDCEEAEEFFEALAKEVPVSINKVPFAQLQSSADPVSQKLKQLAGGNTTLPYIRVGTFMLFGFNGGARDRIHELVTNQYTSD